MNIPLGTGILGCILLNTTLVVCCIPSQKLSPGKVLLVFIATSGISFVPLANLPFVAYERGILGDLSVSSMVLMTMVLSEKGLGRKIYKHKDFHITMVIISISALFLYPCSLGLTYFDPYALGYRSSKLIFVLFLIASFALYFNLYLLLIGILVSVLGFSFKVLPSMNLWDYLIDPLLGFFALGFCLWSLCRIKRISVRKKEFSEVFT